MMSQDSRRAARAPRTLGVAVSVLVALAMLASGAAAQDTSHVRHRTRPGQRQAAQADSTLPDTTHLVHVTLDTAHVDSLALDTLRQAVIRDSTRLANQRDSARSATNCQGRLITAIDIHPQPPKIPVPPNHPRIAYIVQRLNALHATTRPSVIRRFLAFHVGDVCTEERRLESERLIRAQPYIERVHILAVRDGPSGVRLDVSTVDALTGDFGIGVEGRAPLVDLLNLGNSNLLGSAVRVDGQWSYAEGYRDQFGGEVTDYQFLGHPWVADVSGNLAHVGQQLDASVSHPYFTNLQQMAWRVAGGNDQNYIQFVRPGGVYPALDFQRSYANAGALLRVGSPSRFESTGPTDVAVRYSELALIGAALSHESDGIGGRPLDLTGTGPVPDTTVGSPPFGGRYPAHNARRVNGLAGYRALRYLTVRGFDALLGEEDVPVGIQASGVAGASVPWFGGSGDPDTFVSSRIDAAIGSRTSVVQAGIQAEARRDRRTDAWDGLIASGHAAWYLKPSLSQTLIVTTDAATGERVLVPFQLALNDPQGGVEGYAGSQMAGGTRAVSRAEYRHLFRMPLAFLRAAAAWGVAGFVTGGRVWAGDVPYGVTSPMVAAAGLGLLVGVPKESRQLWRVDVAQPLVPEPHTGLELRISTSTAVRLWWTEPDDVSRSREQTVTPDLFTYP
jgi:hypothetical protein